MAERRMFTKKVTDADEFVSLPSSAQALYLHLCMSADDDGFNNQVQLAMFKSHASIDDVKVLLAKRFIIQFDSGVIVIKHWRMANALRKDRHMETSYRDELKMLKIKDNGSYTFSDEMVANRLPIGCQVVANRLPDGCQVVAVDKDSIDKDSINISNSKELDCQKPQADFRHAIELWNSLEDLGIKPVSRIDPSAKRFEMLRARIRQYGMKEYENAINRIRGSDFLQGKHSGRPWQITFDWFVKPNNFPKVLEGNYDNAAHIYGDILDNIS